jgi:hypothetical protein
MAVHTGNGPRSGNERSGPLAEIAALGDHSTAWARRGCFSIAVKHTGQLRDGTDGTRRESHSVCGDKTQADEYGLGLVMRAHLPG